MDIIDNFDDETNGAIWKTAFETIYKDIPSLLAKLVLSKDSRDPMIKIMKVKNKDRLNKVAEIVYDENLINIWKKRMDRKTERELRHQQETRTR